MNVIAFILLASAVFYGPMWGIVFAAAYLLGGPHGLVVAFALRFLKMLAG
jgi:hypothetical protein